MSAVRISFFLAASRWTARAEATWRVIAIECDGARVEDPQLNRAIELELDGPIDERSERVIEVRLACEPDRAVVSARIGEARVERTIDLDLVAAHLRHRALALVARDACTEVEGRTHGPASIVDALSAPSPAAEPVPLFPGAVARTLALVGEEIVPDPEYEIALFGGTRIFAYPQWDAIGGAQLFFRWRWLALAIAIDGAESWGFSRYFFTLSLGAVPLAVREGAFELFAGVFLEAGFELDDRNDRTAGGRGHPADRSGHPPRGRALALRAPMGDRARDRGRLRDRILLGAMAKSPALDQRRGHGTARGSRLHLLSSPAREREDDGEREHE
jgi:hypothetical protein